MRGPLALLFLCLFGLPGLSCRICTAIGCGDSIRITLQGEVALPYQATITFPGGQAVSFACTSAGVEARTGPAVSSVNCRANSFEIHCANSPDFCSTSPVAVEVVGGDRERRSGLLSPRYETFEPNGSRCEPTCRTGTASLP